MRFIVVCIYDKGTAQFGNPFNVVARAQAVRSFADEVNSTDPGNLIAKHPGDFELYVLGGYDSDSGRFDCSEHPERIAQGSDFKA